MSIESFEPTMLLAILPEFSLLVLAGLVLAFDAAWKPEKRRWLGWLTAGGLALIIALTLAAGRPEENTRLVFGGMLRQDWFGFAFKLLFLFGAAITALFAMDMEQLGRRGEFYVLLLVSTLGMSLMASASDIIMLYLAIETTSIPLYVLSGFLTQDDKSTESGFKYLLFGAATSTIMLYGFSLLYGFSGTTNIYDIAIAFHAVDFPLLPVVGSMVLILVGFGFKVSAVPFHFWAPDVYEGAPTPVAGFLSTASKAAGFAVLLRVLLVVFTPVASPAWTTVLAILSVATMTLGNALALLQKNIKRLLAYSSIAHAGYILIGAVAISNLGATSVVFYLIAYMVTNLAAFGVVMTFWRVVGSDELSAYDGLSRRSPWLALVMLVTFLSLAGMPPLVGFVAKVFVFAAAIEANYIWLAVVGVLNSIIGLYYYLTVLKRVYLYRSEETEGLPLPVTRPYSIALGLLTLGIILIGTLFGPWYTFTNQVVSAVLDRF
ncbi:MAG: NADH-quinone oxidoreductase subunit N [Anaerolineales bacterium]|nr:NADH-quinone oxidoreductase subunit N [Anaerolineales bacterium]